MIQDTLYGYILNNLQQQLPMPDEKLSWHTNLYPPDLSVYVAAAKKMVLYSDVIALQTAPSLCPFSSPTIRTWQILNKSMQDNCIKKTLVPSQITQNHNKMKQRGICPTYDECTRSHLH
jgi:hypothetical protein